MSIDFDVIKDEYELSAEQADQQLAENIVEKAADSDQPAESGAAVEVKRLDESAGDATG